MLNAICVCMSCFDIQTGASVTPSTNQSLKMELYHQHNKFILNIDLQVILTDIIQMYNVLSCPLKDLNIKSMPAMQETWVPSLGWENPLEKSMATHSNILAWRISWAEEPGGLQSMGLQRVGYD